MFIQTPFVKRSVSYIEIFLVIFGNNSYLSFECLTHWHQRYVCYDLFTEYSKSYIYLFSWCLFIFWFSSVLFLSVFRIFLWSYFSYRFTCHLYTSSTIEVISVILIISLLFLYCNVWMTLWILRFISFIINNHSDIVFVVRVYRDLSQI